MLSRHTVHYKMISKKFKFLNKNANSTGALKISRFEQWMLDKYILKTVTLYSVQCAFM